MLMDLVDGLVISMMSSVCASVHLRQYFLHLAAGDGNLRCLHHSVSWFPVMLLHAISHHKGFSTGPNSSCRWGSCCWCPSTLGIVQPPLPTVVAQQIHFSTFLHYAFLQLQSLHSAIHTHCSAIRSTLTVIWLSISCCLLALYAAFPFYEIFYLLFMWEGSGILAALMSEALWLVGLLGAVAFCCSMIVLSLGEASTILPQMMQSAVYCRHWELGLNNLILKWESLCSIHW